MTTALWSVLALCLGGVMAFVAVLIMVSVFYVGIMAMLSGVWWEVCRLWRRVFYQRAV